MNYTQEQILEIIQKWEEEGACHKTPFSHDTRHLLIHGHDIRRLPPLPPNLLSLNCQYNQLTELPELPPMLRELNCQHNQLTHLPPLPVGLTILFCGMNQLTELPTLPPHLLHLSCYENPIKRLPSLHSLHLLDCHDTQLQELHIPSTCYIDSLSCSDIDIVIKGKVFDCFINAKSTSIFWLFK